MLSLAPCMQGTHVFLMHQRQRLGGQRDGYWFTVSLQVEAPGFDVGGLAL